MEITIWIENKKCYEKDIKSKDIIKCSCKVISITILVISLSKGIAVLATPRYFDYRKIVFSETNAYWCSKFYETVLANEGVNSMKYFMDELPLKVIDESGKVWDLLKYIIENWEGQL